MHILEVQLATSDLAAQSAFYTQVFQLPVIHADAEKVSFQAGASRLTFIATPQPLAEPYHFAFNIPENQATTAEAWLRQQVPLLADAAGTDAFYSENWDAHNLYFYDPAGNIVELIARHTLPSASQQPFSGAQVLGISEIGIAADDVLAQVAAIVARSGAAVYHGPASPTFTAIGDEYGLFIVVKRGRIWFPDTGKAAQHLPLTVISQTDTEPLTWQFS